MNPPGKQILEFSEFGGEWQPPPKWVSFLMEFGTSWLDKPVDSKRIAVVSMPCESPASGLLALGVLRKCLEQDNANDLENHYRRLVEYADQPENNIEVRHSNFSGVFKLEGVDQDGRIVLWRRKKRGPERISVPCSDAAFLRVNDAAPITVYPGEQSLDPLLYESMTQSGGALNPSNLSKTYSRICLAGLGAGEAVTRRSMESVSFRSGGREATLARLLTIQGWSPGMVSRILFFNSRTGVFDRAHESIRMVIADGDHAFLKAVDNNAFTGGDIIGVIHRNMERDRLERIADKLESLRQWFTVNDFPLPRMPEKPSGMEFLVLAGR